ncbi:MAG: ABC transporter permease subunit [Opitutae bacterium]|nr:ABC transporter permease subunit [Opitutae bacterium]
MKNQSQPHNRTLERFRVSRRTRWFDQFMNHFIVVGGVIVIAAVMGIFVFIIFQVAPLFQGAKVELLSRHQLTDAVDSVVAVDLDEWGELPVLIQKNGSLRYIDLKGDRGILENSQVFKEGETLSSIHYNSQKRLLVAGSHSGKFAFAKISYRPEYDSFSVRTVHPEVSSSDWFDLSVYGEWVQFVDYGEGDSNKLAVGVCLDSEGNRHVRAVSLEQKRSLFGEGGKISLGTRFDLTEAIDQEIQQIDVAPEGDLVLITAENGEVFVFFNRGGNLEQGQRFRPFGDLPDRRVRGADFLLGDASAVFTGYGGGNRVYSLSLDRDKGKRLYAKTKEIEPMPELPEGYFSGVRNKSFLLVGKHHASLRFSTTESIRWQRDFEFEILKGIIGEKYDRLGFLDSAGTFHLFQLRDPHPQAGLKAFLGKIRYEGQAEPDHIWQSTGGTDDFEPKLSLIPLILGSIKGTFYAILFAAPIALLAALYTSQFLHPRWRDHVKPTMEIMASLPSVVLGFMAALWLAPLLDTRVPSLMLVLIGVPCATLACAWCWGRLPQRVRTRMPSGLEFLLLSPVILLTCILCWKAGPLAEEILFVVTNPDTGERVVDFRLWWPEFTGATYTQRNSLVVGFIMGFAVIPVIFSIAEDSLSNVPKSLSSGSLALGASRWQTAVKIVLPTASPGIISALLIGISRALGETMIVVMATGNTPLKDFNIFSGMRTLSANIVVEFPEAPFQGTLYRTLFLGALALFIMTFIINTLAEVLRQHLKNRYKTVQ